MAKAKTLREAPTDRFVSRVDTVRIMLFSSAFADSKRLEQAKIDDRLSTLSEKLVVLNTTTTIDLSADTVSTLTNANLLFD